MGQNDCGRILVVEDNQAFCRVVARALESEGHEVAQASSWSAAQDVLATQSFDTVVTDLDLGDGHGLEVLRLARARRPDTSVVILTWSPDLESAIGAVHHGAMRYLRKPLPIQELRSVVTEAVRSARLDSVRRHLASQALRPEDASVEALSARLDGALATVQMAWQPIVDLATWGVLAYEALVRCDDPMLPPSRLFVLAERLGRRAELTFAIRESVAASLRRSDAQIFLNVRPDELRDGVLLHPDGPLGPYASRITLEITERTGPEELEELSDTLAELRARGFKLALDDLGAGSAGLGSFLYLVPEVAKLDRSLVSELDADPLRRHLFGATVRVCSELGVPVVAEGIETPAELACVREAGCGIGQGYLFGRPHTGPLDEAVATFTRFRME